MEVLERPSAQGPAKSGHECHNRGTATMSRSRAHTHTPCWHALRACGGDNQTNQVTRRTSNIGDGERMTSFVAVKDYLLNAGAEWVDEPVVNCRNMITSRTPDDLTPFCLAIIDAVAAAGS